MASEPYGAAYDADYYAHGCGRPYQRDEIWLGFFRQVAARIVEGIGPESVLDAGCAMGFLVETLRERGVEAWGVDISDYAVGRAHESIQGVLRVGSITEPFERRYDLITCVEVLEHMPPAEAPAAVANLCQHADDILFSSSPEDLEELTHLNVQPPEHWAELFARQGFYRDLDFDASFLTPWAQRFRKGAGADAARRALVGYERRLWHLARENATRREVALGLRDQLAERERDLDAARDRIARLEAREQELEVQLYGQAQQIEDLGHHAHAWRARWQALEASPGYGVLTRLQDARARLLPAGSPRERAFLVTLGWLGIVRARGLRFLLGHLWREGRRWLAWRRRERQRRRHPERIERIALPRLSAPEPPAPHRSTVDIVVCVHDAPEDVSRCLDSVLRHSREPYRLILVDDGSAAETAGLLEDFAARYPERTLRIRHEEAGGYTRAANAGLRASTAERVILLNSDTIVTAGWLDRLLECADSQPRVGLVGPLSNTASYQSIPRVSQDGDWAENPLPEDLSIDEMAELVAADSARLWPEMTILNGFCLLLTREIIEELGLFDEQAFGAGYGEENDYCIRARDAGWRLLLADDAFVWHAQSRSYSHERRKSLADRSGRVLVERHGAERLIADEARLQSDPVLEGIRARALRLVDRQRIRRGGRDRFGGRSLLFVLPLGAAGGGANIVLREARAMREMGVSVALFNLEKHRAMFEAAYPDLDLPVVWGREQDLAQEIARWDAIVATHYETVAWLDLARRGPYGEQARLGYYVQDVEAYFYPPGSERFHEAWQSYQRVPDLVLFTKTDWNAEELRRLHGVEASVVGASYDLDRFRPRPRPDAAGGPLRITAMVRPGTPFRSPEMTMRILGEIARRHGPRVDCVIFGVEPEHPGWDGLPRDFAFRLAGALHPSQVAALLAESDVFVDFSTHQAMGLTAMEAMACGCAVVLPRRGGGDTFARHEANALVVDTGSEPECLAALDRLVQDAELRARLGRQALRDICHFHPERPAFRILDALFGAEIDAAAAERAAREVAAGEDAAGQTIEPPAGAPDPAGSAASEPEGEPDADGA